jgi:hypothetical protein
MPPRRRTPSGCGPQQNVHVVHAQTLKSQFGGKMDITYLRANHYQDATTYVNAFLFKYYPHISWKK